MLNQFLDRQRIFVCSKLSVNKQETTSYHTLMVLRLPIVLSNGRPAARVTKPHGALFVT